jgi:hypothetical protein
MPNPLSHDALPDEQLDDANFKTRAQNMLAQLADLQLPDRQPVRKSTFFDDSASQVSDDPSDDASEPSPQEAAFFFGHVTGLEPCHVVRSDAASPAALDEKVGCPSAS